MLAIQAFGEHCSPVRWFLRKGESMSLSYERTGWKKGNRGWRKKGRSRRKTRTERGIDENRHSKQADR